MDDCENLERSQELQSTREEHLLSFNKSQAPLLRLSTFFLRIYQFISNTNLYRSIEIFKIFTKIWRQILDQRLRKVYNYVDGKGGIVG